MQVVRPFFFLSHIHVTFSPFRTFNLWAIRHTVTIPRILTLKQKVSRCVRRFYRFEGLQSHEIFFFFFRFPSIDRTENIECTYGGISQIANTWKKFQFSFNDNDRVHESVIKKNYMLFSPDYRLRSKTPFYMDKERVARHNHEMFLKSMKVHCFPTIGTKVLMWKIGISLTERWVRIFSISLTNARGVCQGYTVGMMMI